MTRETTTRRMALLALVGAAAAFCAISVRPGVTGVALASPPATAPAPARHARMAAGRVAACPFPANLRAAFVAASRDASLPPAMLYAVAKVESNLRADALSTAGARGLLQVMPATARALDLDIDEPGSNVLAGARYLRELMDRFGSADLALAAYNAGPTAVSAAGGSPTIGVQRYVSNVDLVWRSVAGCR